MSRLVILVGTVLLAVTGCSQQADDQPVAPGGEANDSADAQLTETRSTNAQGVSSQSDDENGKSKGRLRDKHEDEITTRLGRAILDVLDEEGDGTDEERDAIIATLKLNDEMLHRASGRRAKQLILQNNNRPRSLYVAPPPE